MPMTLVHLAKPQQWDEEEGDFRDWPAIEAWASEIARALVPEVVAAR